MNVRAIRTNWRVHARGLTRCMEEIANMGHVTGVTAAEVKTLIAELEEDSKTVKNTKIKAAYTAAIKDLKTKLKEE